MFELDAPDVVQRSSTGTPPRGADIDALLQEAWTRYSAVDDGTVADYIPVLAEADPSWFGLSFVSAGGSVHGVGDVQQEFSIQSVSKAFVFALVCDSAGHERIHDVIGVNNTGLAFNSVIAVELNGGSPMNSMVNAGAMATTAMIDGGDVEERWDHILDGLSRCAGRQLHVDERVLASEAATNHRNQSIARLLQSYGRLAGDPAEAVDLYTRQCSVAVTAQDLAVMGATLADGGVNPITGERVISAETARDTLALMASCGLYERSGEWLYEIGMPAKSGVSGGIVAVAPGKGAIGTFAPRLDSAGNSVRGQRACAHLSRALGLNIFASQAGALPQTHENP